MHRAAYDALTASLAHLIDPFRVIFSALRAAYCAVAVLALQTGQLEPASRSPIPRGGLNSAVLETGEGAMSDPDNARQCDGRDGPVVGSGNGGRGPSAVGGRGMITGGDNAHRGNRGDLFNV